MNSMPEPNSSQLSAIARIFSSTVLRELAAKGESALFSRLLTQSSLANHISADRPLKGLFDAAFDILKIRSNRHEYVYKNAIAQKVLLGRHSPYTAAMLTEFRTGNHKADVIILNGTSTVYEIKSERDSLDRLLPQLESYLKVCASVNVITGENHLAKVRKMIPEEVGIMELSRRFTISTIREAVNRPERIDPSLLFLSLRISEAKEIVKAMGLELPSLPNTQMHRALQQMFEAMNPVDVHEKAISALRNNRSSRPLAELFEQLPKSLTAAAMATGVPRKDHLRLIDTLNVPVSSALAWA